jgi:putative addiction module component (TIGR02574 family)
MSITLTELEQQARALTAADRERLVEVLLDSLRQTEIAEIEAEWKREIAKRVTAYAGRARGQCYTL